MPTTIRINRAPVLTLWAAVVAERVGYPPETALTLGRFVAGSSARAKARRLGIVEETEDAAERREKARELRERRQTVRLLGREIPVLPAPDGTLRAEDDGKPVIGEERRGIRRARVRRSPGRGSRRDGAPGGLAAGTRAEPRGIPALRALPP